MPPPVSTSGAARARAGLGEVKLTQTEIRAVRAERAARALVSILPHGCASFIIHDPPDVIAAEEASAVAERLVSALSQFGVGSLEQAFGSLGCLKTWAAANRPGALVSGSVISDFLAAQPANSRDRHLGAFAWLSDWCGIDMPARAPIARQWRQGAPSSENDKESFGLFIVLGLEQIAALHPCAFVRGHAAAWLFMALHALRLEQAQALVINAFVDHAFDGETFEITAAATLRDKNPNAAKVRPRPVWGVLAGFVHRDAARVALASSLQGAEDVRCILRDTDSPSGDPTTASAWVACGASRARAEKSLHALLQLPPISLPREAAERYHAHSAKRFLLNCAEASSEFDDVDANAIGRFSGSTAQDPDLEPVEAMLQRHALSSSILPQIYAGKAKVSKAFDLLARLHCTLRRVSWRHVNGERVLPPEGGWTLGFFGAP